MRLRTALPAGLVDAGCASLATFAIGLVAVTQLEPDVLGVYALFVAAFFVAAIVPTQLTAVPAEMQCLRRPAGARLAHLPRTVQLVAAVSAVSALGIVLVPLVVPRTAPTAAILALTVTAAACSFLSPVQDHVRRMLHVSQRSWQAAAMSVVQLAATLGAALLLTVAAVPAAIVPFGALTLANLVSLAFGVTLARPPVVRLHDDALRLRRLAPTGGWLVAVGLAPAASGFVAGAVIANLAGAATLGFAEAARVAGQPVLVLATGLSAVTGPRSIEAAQRRARADARRLSAVFLSVVTLAGVAYLALVAIDWSGNVLRLVLPTAYVVPGLVAVTVVANLLNGVVFPARSELMGAGRERRLAGVEVVGGLAHIGLALTAGVIGAFARPVALGVQGAVRTIGFRRAARRLYEPVGASDRAVAPTPPLR